MHRDKKLGLALGVLLVGIVGAFFFRLDHKKKDRGPQLNNPQSLNKQIADKPGAPYAGDANDSVPQPPAEQKKVAEPPLWQMPEFLAEGRDEMPEDWLAQTPATPDPIVQDWHGTDEAELFAEDSDEDATEARIVAHNVSQSKPAQADDEGGEYIVHVVRSGDTLSRISAQYLGSSARFNDIYELNREVLGDPNNLTVGSELKIPKKSQAPAVKKPSSMQHVADGKHRVDAQNVSTKKVAPPSEPLESRANSKPADAKPGSPRRFVPVSKPPFVPGRQEKTSSEKTSLNPRKTLSQVPPSNLPEAD